MSAWNERLEIFLEPNSKDEADPKEFFEIFGESALDYMKVKLKEALFAAAQGILFKMDNLKELAKLKAIIKKKRGTPKVKVNLR